MKRTELKCDGGAIPHGLEEVLNAGDGTRYSRVSTHHSKPEAPPAKSKEME